MKKEHRGGVPLAGLTVAAILLASTAGYVSALSRMFQAPVMLEESRNDFLADADAAAPAAKIPAASFEQSLGRVAAAWLVNALPAYSSGRARDLWYLSLDSSGDRRAFEVGPAANAPASYSYAALNVGSSGAFSPALGVVGSTGANNPNPSAPTVTGATLFWDADGSTSSATGGTGNWLGGSTWRLNTSTGTLQAWEDANRANFGGTAGTVTLNGAVSATGMTFSVGGYTISGANSLTLTSTTTVSGTQAIETTNGSGTNTISSNIILGAAGGSNQRFSIASGGTLLISGDISEANAGIILSKSGAGTLTLSGNNSYSGGTLLTAGVIAVGTNTALGSGALTFSDSTTLQSADANTRTLANVWSPGGGTSNTTFGSATTGDLVLTDGTSFSLGTTIKTFTVNNNATTISKIFTSSSSAGGLTKAGAGTLVLQGNSTFTGPTLISAGTLDAAATGALGSGTTGTSGITVNAGGTLLLSNTGVTDRVKNTAPVALGAGTGTPSSGGNLSLGKTADTTSTSETIGALTLNNNSTIDFASTSGSHFTLTAAGSVASTLAATAANYALVLNWDGTIGTLGTSSTDRLLFQNGVTGFTDGSVTNQLVFNIGGQLYNTEFLDYDGVSGSGLEAVPFQAIPEPSTWIGAALALGAVAWAQRKRRRVIG